MKDYKTMYTESGNAICVLHILPGGEGYVGQPILYDDEDEEFLGDAGAYSRLYDAPPRTKKDEEIQKLEAKRSELVSEISRLRGLEVEAKEAAKAFEDTIAGNKQLETLRLFLDGKITHVVQTSYCSVVISALEEALKSSNPGISNQMKLVSLFGRSNGDLSWGINGWSDGSGSNADAWFFTSEDEAKKFVQQKINEVDENSERPPIDKWVDAAVKYGLSLPHWMESEHKNRKRKTIEDKIKDLESRLDQARQELTDVL